MSWTESEFNAVYHFVTPRTFRVMINNILVNHQIRYKAQVISEQSTKRHVLTQQRCDDLVAVRSTMYIWSKADRESCHCYSIQHETG